MVTSRPCRASVPTVRAKTSSYSAVALRARGPALGGFDSAAVDRDFHDLSAFGALAFAALVELASAAMELGPQLWPTFVLDAALQLDQPVEHGLGTRRASENVDVA
jgi:hypothetical protein